MRGACADTGGELEGAMYCADTGGELEGAMRQLAAAHCVQRTAVVREHLAHPLKEPMLATRH